MRKYLSAFVAAVNGRQIIIGMGALLPGILVYLSDRPAHRTFFVHKLNIGLEHLFPNLFGSIGDFLPDFVHPFAFILLTAGITANGRTGYIVISLGWLLVNCFFELGQKFGTLMPAVTPAGFDALPFFGMVKAYFIGGTFDPLDLLAIGAGTGLAYWVLLATRKDERKN